MDKGKMLPKIAFVFADLSYGGSNLQTVRIIQHSGAMDNCIVITLTDIENDTAIEEKLIQIGINPIHFHFDRKKFVSELARLREVIKENKCEIVNSNGLRSDMACHYAFRGTETKHIITLHNYLREDAFLRMSRPKAMLATMMQTLVLRSSKYVIACSKTLQQQTESDIRGLKVTAIQNGIDPNDYPIMDKRKLRRQYGYPEDALIFISTVSMTLRKRIPETVDAFLQADIPGAIMLLAGDGPYLGDYRKRYEENKGVTFLGRRGDIKELLNIEDIFVSSSESEGLPLAVLEALSAQNYVCLSDIPQHREILEEFSGAGQTYRLGDVGGLTELLRVQGDTVSDCTKVTLKHSCFDIEAMGKAYKDYYMSI